MNIEVRAWDKINKCMIWPAYIGMNDEECYKDTGRKVTDFILEQYIGLDAPLKPCKECEPDEDEDLLCDDCERKKLYIGDLIKIWIESSDWNKEHYDINENGYQIAEIRETKDLGYKLSFVEFRRKGVILGQSVEMESLIEHMRLEDADYYLIGNIHQNEAKNAD